MGIRGMEDIMKLVNHGRRKLTFENGEKFVTSTSVTERSLRGEDEKAFLHRLMEKYGHCQGTIEVVFKNGKPDYAMVTMTDVM